MSYGGGGDQGLRPRKPEGKEEEEGLEKIDGGGPGQDGGAGQGAGRGGKGSRVGEERTFWEVGEGGGGERSALWREEFICWPGVSSFPLTASRSV